MVDSPAVLSPTIRLAGVEDIAAVARITQEGPPRPDVDPEVLARTTRLLLANIALERGSLWVEAAPDGRIARAVAAVPGTEKSSWLLPGRDAILRLEGLEGRAMAAPVEAGAGRALLAELTAIGPCWVLSEISKVPVPPDRHTELLTAALRWADAQPRRGDGPVVVVADCEAERDAAVAAGFVERRSWGAARETVRDVAWDDAGTGWWIGARDTVPDPRT